MSEGPSSWPRLELWEDPRVIDGSESTRTPGRFEIGQLSATRAEILSLHAEAGFLERPKLALAFMRLALMTELLDSLWTEAPTVALELAGFCEEAYQAIHLDLDELEEEQIADRILSTSTERWSCYFDLLDFGHDDSIEETDRDSARPEEVDEASTSRPNEIVGRPKGSAASSARSAIERPSDKDFVEETDEPSTGDVKARSIPLRRTLFETPASPSTIFGGLEIPDAPRRVAIDPEFAETFLDEANDLFERVQGLVLTLSPGKDHRQTLLELGRCFHTLKGAAGSVGLDEFAGLIHSTEEAIESKNLNGNGLSDLRDLLHRLLRYMESLFRVIRTGQSPSPPPLPIGAPSPSPSPSGMPEPSPPAVVEAEAPTIEGPVRISSERLDELLDLVSELITRRGLWAAQAETLKEFSTLAKSSRNRLLSTVDRIQDLRPTKASIPFSNRFQNRQSDLPELSRRLAEQADDLLILTDGAQSFAKPLSDNSDALASLTLKIWESLQALRIVPVKGLFQRLARVAHDAARVEGRRVEVMMTGDEIGLDRAVQDKAFEPMLHIVRNAVAHGIESTAERRKIGKPETGVVSLEAVRAGNTMILTVKDDGKGLDHRAIELKGRRLGLIGPDETPDADRLNSLIFQPGFSTKDEANAISGRGVGMDVVTQEVAKIHGTVVLNSSRGEGTRVSLHLPARLSLVQAMLVRVDDQLFSIPVELIEEVESFDRSAIEFRQSKAWIRGRKEWAPLVPAREALGIESDVEALCPKILLVRVEGKPIAVLIDSIDGTRELVIKPLGPLVVGHPMISGSSLLVTGEVVLALDPIGLARRALQEMGGRSLPESAISSSQGKPSILVVDDSISVRKVVARHLRGIGLKVDEASDGLEAMVKVREHHFAMILTDLEMPRMDGFELLSELSNHANSKAIPVVVTSTRTDEETLRRISELGARAFIPKPIDPEALGANVRKWIGETNNETPPRAIEPAASSCSTESQDRGLTCNPL